MNLASNGSAFACAKFILGGEHSIVDRGSALSFPLKNLILRVKEIPEGILKVNQIDLTKEYFSNVQSLRRLFGAKRLECGIEVLSNIPIGAGLGSSAALCIALARLYTKATGVELAQLAIEGEKIFHGNPSGIDPFTVAFEEALAFSRDQKMRRLNAATFQNDGYCFVLKDTKVRHNTGEVIGQVKGLKERSHSLWDSLMNALSINAEAMISAFETMPSTLGPIMSDSHQRLRELGVSNLSLDAAVAELLKLGALGAKLTGAGCGGFALGLFKREHAQSLGLNISY